mgnify:CR=1 FL=1
MPLQQQLDSLATNDSIVDYLHRCPEWDAEYTREETLYLLVNEARIKSMTAGRETIYLVHLGGPDTGPIVLVESEPGQRLHEVWPSQA